MADITVKVQSPGSEYWGQSNWGSNDWGGSGLSLTTSQNSVTISANADVSVTGIQIASSQGTTVALTSSIGAATVDESELTGIGWGRRTWGNLAWGGAFSVIATGQTLTSSIGSAIGKADVTVSVTSAGQISTTFANPSFSIQIDQDIFVLASEDQLDFSIGTSTFDADANVTVTSAGSLTGSIGTTVAGLKTPVDVSGIQLTSTLGTFSLIQTTVESPTGLQATMSLGQHAEIPGQIIGVSGQQITAAAGQTTVVADALVHPTGIQMTMSVGSPNITAWAEVNPGVNNVWTEVDLAA